MADNLEWGRIVTVKSKERINWMSVIAAFVALITLSAHFMWVGGSLESKAGRDDVMVHEARIKVLEAMIERQSITLDQIDRKVTAIMLRESLSREGG